MKFLYKYPQAEFPYSRLVEENRRRDRRAPEFELMDTGVFEGDRYFDVLVEYAKAAPDDLLIRITATNRGPEAAELHLLPPVWHRNTWSSAAPRRPAGRGAAPAPRQHADPGAHIRQGLRRRIRPAAGRGGRVLRDGDPEAALGRCQERHAPGVRGAALVQAVLPLLRPALARGRSRVPAAPSRALAGAEPRVVPPLQRGRHLDAGQVGVPVVRGVGPSVPHDSARADRPRLRQDTAPPVLARVVHA